MKVVVVGGGFSGLASAHWLADAGGDVTLLESNDQLGGLGTFFESGGKWIDRFYHCIMPSDDHLLRLIDEVGLTDQLYWKPTRMGFIDGGVKYPFNTAIDLLRFRPLTLPQRVRFGVTSLLLRRLGKGKDLDNTNSEIWLTHLYGQSVWNKVWAPLFRSKFGPVEEVPALYLWQRLGRERNNSTRGYLRCGHKGLIDAIEGSIRSNGGDIRTEAEVTAIRQQAQSMQVELADGEVIDCDWVISTVPLPLLRKLTSNSPLGGTFRDPNLPYQGVVNVLFFLSRPLDGYYWAPVLNSGTDFDGVVEMSTLVEPSQYGNRHLVYVMKYTDRASALFQESDEVIAKRWCEQFLALNKDLGLTREEIVEIRVFRAPFVEPSYPLGYSQLKPEIRSGDSRLLLATTTQVYPNITSWNSSSRLAGEVIRLLQSSKLPEGVAGVSD